MKGIQQSKILPVIAVVVLLALVTVSAATTGTVLAEQQPKVLGRVTALALNVRQGDGVGYEIYGALGEGDEVEITGVNSTRDWLQIVYTSAPDGRGWVSAYYVETTSGDLAQLPQVKPAAPGATSSESSALSGKLVFRTRNGGDIYIVNADGSGLHRLTDGMDPLLSPDGTQVAFIRWREPRGLYLINADGSGERLLFGVQEARFPAWSPDGTQIAFSFQNGYKPEEKECEMREVDDELKEVCTIYPEDWYWTVAMVNVHDASYQDVPSALHSYSPAWSPDGKYISYRAEKGLVKVDLADPTGRLDGLTDDYNDYAPTWSPDGAHIALTYDQNGLWEVHSLTGDGAVRQQLTQSTVPGSSSASPAWSPDGQYIAFVSNRRGAWELWTMRADGSEQKPLFEDGMPVAIEEVGVDDRVVSWGP
jgi:Tol biopolymer transport system component